jgi:hypothetical protein
MLALLFLTLFASPKSKSRLEAENAVPTSADHIAAEVGGSPCHDDWCRGRRIKECRAERRGACPARHAAYLISSPEWPGLSVRKRRLPDVHAAKPRDAPDFHR